MSKSWASACKFHIQVVVFGPFDKAFEKCPCLDQRLPLNIRISCVWENRNKCADISLEISAIRCEIRCEISAIRCEIRCEISAKDVKDGSSRNKQRCEI